MNHVYVGCKCYTEGATEAGVITGVSARSCFDGCPGPRLIVRWEDKKQTYPCARGMFMRDDMDWQIGSPAATGMNS
jgi:hypothetical protein